MPGPAGTGSLCAPDARCHAQHHSAGTTTTTVLTTKTATLPQSDKHTALHSAAEKGLTDMMSFLLSHGAHVKVHDKVSQRQRHLQQCIVW